MPFKSTLLPVPISHLHALQSYSKILSKHGRYASIDDSVGMEVILGALLESIELLVENVNPMNDTDEFFAAVYNAKKMIRELYLGFDYFELCKTDPALHDMTAKWLVKLPIYALDIFGSSTIPTQIQAILHLLPMLNRLSAHRLDDCAAIHLSECKSLRKLVFLGLLDGKESPEKIVEKVHLVKGTSIQQLEMAPGGEYFNEDIPSDLKDSMPALFLEHGWKAGQCGAYRLRFYLASRGRE